MAKKNERVLWDPPGQRVALVGRYNFFAEWCVKWGVSLHTVRPLLTLHDARGLGDGLIVLIFSNWWQEEADSRPSRRGELDRIGLLVEGKAEVWRDIDKLDPVVEKGQIVGWREKI